MRASREIMAELAQSGLTPEQQALLMELSAAVSVEARPIVDASAERRRAKDRERKKNVRGNPQTSAESADIAEQQKEVPGPLRKTTTSSPPKGGSGSFVDELFEAQPVKHRRSTRPDIRKALDAAVKRGSDPAQIVDACRAYFAHPDRQAEDGKFAKGVHRLIEADRWRDYLPAPAKPVVLTEDAWRGFVDHWDQTGQWRGPGPPPNDPACQAPPALVAPFRAAA